MDSQNLTFRTQNQKRKNGLKAENDKIYNLCIVAVKNCRLQLRIGSTVEQFKR